MTNGSSFVIRHSRFVALASCVVAWLVSAAALAQEPGLLSEFGPTFDESGAPTTEFGGGVFFSQELGTLVRIRYNTESYGQDNHGNLDIGTMKVVNFGDATTFFDGQVTLNDVGGVGFNTGLGFRWMSWTPFPLEPERINGFSIWADGTHSSSGGFFPQIGLSWESLGDMWDFRVNSYIPLGERDHVGDFVPTGNIVFQDSFLVSETVADRFTSFNAAELEVARRMGSERDAWAFAGPYALSNDDDETVGYRVGLRGYAYPDLLVQFAVSDDDIFHTNASFSIIWFVGRTRTDFQPACGLPDRMREPVMRNDYVVLAKDQVIGGIELTDTDGDTFRFVHVDSEAPGGGDGTFENPLDDVANVNGNSMDGDIILLYSDSTFNMQGPLALGDDQRLLGEGEDMTFQITTQQEGTIDIPETSPGSQAGAKPILMNATGTAITLADANEVANLAIDGGMVGIAAGVDGAGNPNLHDLMIMNTTGDAIVLSPLVRTDPDDPSLLTVAGNVTIDEVMFDNIGGDDIDIDSSTIDVTDPDVTLLETISITNIESTNGSGRGLLLTNTHSGGTATINNYVNGDPDAPGMGGGLAGNAVLRFVDIGGNIALNNVDVMDNVGYAFDFLDVADTSTVTIDNSSYDGAAGLAGGMRFDGADGTFTVSNTTLTGGTMGGVTLINTPDGIFTFANTTTFDGVGGVTFNVDAFDGTLTMDSEIISNIAGQAIRIENVSLDKASLTFNGNITMHDATTEGIFIANNTDGTIIFGGDSTLITTGANAVTLSNNGDTDINFNGLLDITTSGGTGFSATGGGLLTVLGTDNTIDATSGTGVEIDQMEISNAGVAFERVDSSMAASGIVLTNNTGTGTVTIGDSGNNTGEGGTLSTFMGAGIQVTNTNATFNGVDVSDAGTGGGGGTIEVVHDNADGMTVALNDVNVDAQNAAISGITVNGSGATGAFTMTAQDVDIESDNATALLFTDLDGTTTFNNLSIHDSWSGLSIVTSDGSFTFNNQTTIDTVNAIDFEVSGGAASVSMAGNIDNTDGAGDQSINIHEITGGNVTMTGTVTDDNGGIVVDMNTGGDVNLLGSYTINTTGATNAITITDNMGADISIGGFTVTTENGTGFLATGGGDLTVNGTNNTIDTTAGTGVGLQIDGMNVVGQANFASVNVDGAANGIVLTDVSGGQVAIGNFAGAQNSGGALTTTGDAIVLRDVQNVDLRHIRIVNSTAGDGVAISHTNAEARAMDVTIDDLNLDAAFGAGVDVTADNDTNSFTMRLTDGDLERNVAIDVTGAGQFNLLADGMEIDIAVGTADIAFDLQFHDGATDGDVALLDNDFAADTGRALFIDSFDATAKDIKLLIEDSDFLTNGVVAAADIRSRGNTVMQATIQGNTFDAVAAGDDLYLLSDSTATARMRLNLGGTDVADFNSALGAGSLLVEEGGTSVFSIFERDDTITADVRNADPVDTLPNDAAFDDLGTAPDLPVSP